jgi:hypothetical protein
VDQWGSGGDQSGEEGVDVLTEEDAVVVTLFQANGVGAEEVEGGDNLHSNVLAW